MIKIAIVEDEEIAAKKLGVALERYRREKRQELEVVRYADATAFLKDYRAVDIVFMDILLPYLNGMDAAKRLREIDSRVALIFVTNMRNYAVKGYEVDALDFIVKPISYESFAVKMDKAIKRVKSNTGVSLSVKSDGAVHMLSSSDVLYAEVDGHQLIYFTDKDKFSTRGTMDEIESLLSSEGFYRCNSCYLVNMKYITDIKGDIVIVSGGSELRISRNRKKEFLSAFANFLGKSI